MLALEYLLAELGRNLQAWCPGPPWPPAAEGANPKLRIGRQVIEGANTGLHAGLNANLNEKGELWIGYLKKASC